MYCHKKHVTRIKLLILYSYDIYVLVKAVLNRSGPRFVERTAEITLEQLLVAVRTK